jgi:hypothetical protein
MQDILIKIMRINRNHIVDLMVMKTPNLHLNNGKYGRLLQRNIKYENVVL